MPDVSIKEMREFGYLPTVTSIDSVLHNPFLELWKRKGAVDAALDLSDDQKAGDRKELINFVLDTQRQVSIDAAERGTEIHAGAQAMLEGKIWNQLDPQLQAIDEYIRENISDVEFVERPLINHQLGYAGTCDLKARHRKHGPVLLDWKSQNCKPLRSGKPRISFYPSWELQLSAYREIEGRELGCVSVVIDKNSKTIKEKLWPTDSVDRAFETFKSLHHVWCWQHKYWPGETAGVPEEEASS